MDEMISLRQFINNKELFNSLNDKSFCRLMKRVENVIDQKEGNLIKINLDEILINKNSGEIVLPDSLFSKNPDLEKTIASFDTGVSLMADRKASLQNKRVSFALMVLGWFVNLDGNAVSSDMDVLENYDEYMNLVPLWLHDYFDSVFKKMNYEETFSNYYDKNFTEKVVKDIRESFKEFDLKDDQMKRIISLIIRETNKRIKDGDLSEEG